MQRFKTFCNCKKTYRLRWVEALHKHNHEYKMHKRLLKIEWWIRHQKSLLLYRILASFIVASELKLVLTFILYILGYALATWSINGRQLWKTGWRKNDADQTSTTTAWGISCTYTLSTFLIHLFNSEVNEKESIPRLLLGRVLSVSPYQKSSKKGRILFTK